MLILFSSSEVNTSSNLRTWAWLSLPWVSPQSQLIYPKYILSLGKNFLSWKTRASTPVVYCLSPSLHSAWQYEIVSFMSSFGLRLSAIFSSVQSLSRVQLCDSINRSMPGLPLHHQLPEFTQTHVHWISDAIQLSPPLSSPSPPAPNPSQHQSLFQWVNSSHEVAKVLELQL